MLRRYAYPFVPFCNLARFGALQNPSPFFAFFRLAKPVAFCCFLLLLTWARRVCLLCTLTCLLFGALGVELSGFVRFCTGKRVLFCAFWCPGKPRTIMYHSVRSPAHHAKPPRAQGHAAGHCARARQPFNQAHDTQHDHNPPPPHKECTRSITHCRQPLLPLAWVMCSPRSVARPCPG